MPIQRDLTRLEIREVEDLQKDQHIILMRHNNPSNHLNITNNCKSNDNFFLVL